MSVDSPGRKQAAHPVANLNQTGGSNLTYRRTQCDLRPQQVENLLHDQGHHTNKKGGLN